LRVTTFIEEFYDDNDDETQTFIDSTIHDLLTKIKVNKHSLFHLLPPHRPLHQYFLIQYPLFFKLWFYYSFIVFWFHDVLSLCVLISESAFIYVVL